MINLVCGPAAGRSSRRILHGFLREPFYCTEVSVRGSPDGHSLEGILIRPVVEHQSQEEDVGDFVVCKGEPRGKEIPSAPRDPAGLEQCLVVGAPCLQEVSSQRISKRRNLTQMVLTA